MNAPIALPEPTARIGLWLPGLTMLLLALPATAQDAVNRTIASDGLGVVVAEGRQWVVLPPYGSASDAVQPLAAVQSASGGLTSQSFETADRRIHVVTFDGETYRAATPLAGPRSRIAFDPARRVFAPLLPSIRIELNASVNLDTVADALGALGVTVFESLGFAIVDLPADLHPADAVARVRELPGEPDAAVRLRGPPIEWK